MNKDNEDDEPFMADANIPTFAEAVRERDERIAELKKEGDRDLADRLAQCHKGKRCNEEDCPVCERRHKVVKSRFPSLIRDRPLRFIVYELRVDAIKIIGPRRPINEKKLRELKASIHLIDLQTPITVRFRKKEVILVAGLHRVMAMKQLGRKWISCFEHYNKQSESFFWQRSENLYRAEPRVLERAEYIDEMRQQAILLEGGQVAPPGGRQPKNAGIKRAAKVLGLTRDEVRRSMRIAQMISPKAKVEARRLGLDDNQHALLEIAKLPANAQCAAVKAIVDGQLAARARLASRAVTAVSEKAAAKIQAIEDKIAKKKETLQAIKAELGDERDRLDGVHDELAAAYVNNALINGASVQPADGEDIVVVRGGPLSSEDEASLKALLADWDEAHTLKRKFAKASPAVRDCFWEKIQQMVSVQGGNRETELEASEQEQP
jgi:ParB-like chromosome segregation protein Spo0J